MGRLSVTCAQSTLTDLGLEPSPQPHWGNLGKTSADETEAEEGAERSLEMRQ